MTFLCCTTHIIYIQLWYCQNLNVQQQKCRLKSSLGHKQKKHNKGYNNQPPNSRDHVSPSVTP